MNSFHSTSAIRRRRLQLEKLECRRVLTAMPYGAMETDTGEFLLGDVAVTPVFFESNGQLDPSTENWNELKIQTTLNNINQGLQWWDTALDNLNTVHDVDFTVDTTFVDTPFSTQYEGINRRSNDYSKYVQEFLNAQGYNSFSLEANMKAFNHDKREDHNANWAFTIIVVPSFNDVDGEFAPGGSFRRAFAFAGGLFMVVPSTRPASTFAHELGHIFWSRDEYVGGGTYFSRRGYYNTLNENAHDNPDPDFEQQPSIMASGSLLETAYQNHISPASTLAMVGWQDSDGDGIFDVLDVPHSLTGTGFLDTNTSTYRFTGRAAVQTLPNLNSSGNGNDITLNRIRQIEYRFDDGPWQPHSAPDAYEVDLDLSISVPSAAQEIEIRARDSETTVVSNVFQGRLDRADSTTVPGINGFVWIDNNQNGLRDIGEYGSSLWNVELVDAFGNNIETRINVEPDDFPDGQINNSSLAGVSLQAVGLDADGRVGVFTDTGSTSTGTKNFRVFSRATRSYLTSWNSETRRLQAEFDNPTSSVSIDVIGTSISSIGRLEAFNSEGQLVGRYTTSVLNVGEVETMTIERAASDIAYVIAGSHISSSVKLDFLRFGPQSQMFTGVAGSFAFPGLQTGTYNVRVTPSGAFRASDPESAEQQVQVVAGSALVDVDFGFQPTTSPWQNPVNEFDINGDTFVSAIDVLLLVDDLNRIGSRSLPTDVVDVPPYLDPSGDGHLSPLDALLVIFELNTRANAEGEFYGPPLPEDWFSSARDSIFADEANSFTENGLSGEGEAIVADIAETTRPAFGFLPFAGIQIASSSEEDADKKDEEAVWLDPQANTPSIRVV
ncbi:MAG: dockerin type I domain-containing protein [Planctomycetota bacterium]